MLGHTLAVPDMLALLQDPEPVVRWYTASALGELCDPRAVDALVAALGDEDRRVSRAAGAALARMGEPLAALLRDTAQPAESRHAAARGHSLILWGPWTTPEDLLETTATIRGSFFVRSKHVSGTMDGDETAEDAFDLRDVPYIQYFHEGYALHAAYWHDDFGKERSHGCVNLAPADAAWLFEWTDPPVPKEWHGAMAPQGGTLVWIHG